MDYISVAGVRRTTGIGTDLLNNTDIGLMIDDVEKYTERWLNTKFAPTTVVETVNGDDSDTIILRHNPVLAVREVKIDGDTLSPLYLNVYRESGKVIISTQDGDSPEVNKFKKGDQLCNFKYVHGWVEHSTTQTSTSAALESTDIGTSVTIDVVSSTGLLADNWVEIEDTDGYKEACKILSVTDLTHIVVDQIVFTHTSGSLVTLLENPYFIKRYMELEAGLYAIANVIGSTYTFSTSFNIGPFSAVKGVPYPHFTAVASRLEKERDRIKSMIALRPAIFKM